MGERYEKLFSLPRDLYAVGSPLLIAAGNLLKDTQTGRVLAQIKLKNVSDRTIKAATVAFHALDTMGRPLDGDTEKEYLDLQAAPGESFGQKVPVLMPNASTRGLEAAGLFGQLKDYKDSEAKREEAERRGSTERARARLAGKGYHYESEDPHMAIRVDMQLREDGGLQYFFEMPEYRVDFEDARYEVVTELEADKILVSCEVGTVRSVQNGEETVEKDRQAHWVIEMNDKDEIQNFNNAHIFVCEKGQSMAMSDDYNWQFRIFMTGEGEVWKILEPG